MAKISARDCRSRALSGAPDIEVDYDPAKIQQFDTRGKCAVKWQESWGQKVDVEIGGEHFMLYLEHFGHTLGHVNKHRNFLKEC